MLRLILIIFIINPTFHLAIASEKSLSNHIYIRKQPNTINTKLSKSSDHYEIAQSLKCTNVFPYFERKYRIPTNTLHSISLRESGKLFSNQKFRIVWPWAVNVGGQGYYFKTKREAVYFVKKQISDGKTNIDVGCMQISLKHHMDAFSSIEQAFNPKTNVAYGAEFLRSKYDQLQSWHKAIAHYHSATDELGLKYKNEVIKIAKNMDHYNSSLKRYVKNYEIPRMNRINKSSTLLVATIDRQQKDLHYSTRMKSNMMIPIKGIAQ